MEKFKTATIYFLVFVLLSFAFQSKVTAQYTFNGPGQWSDITKWSGTTPSSEFLGGNINDVTNQNITINDRATVGTATNWVDLIIQNNTALTIGGDDTLFIWGSLIFQNTTTNNINISGALIIRGDLIIRGTGYMNLSGTGSSPFVGISGSLVNEGSNDDVYNSNSSNVYILGTSSEPITCSDPDEYDRVSHNGGCEYGSRTALIQNEDAKTKKLLLGDIPLGADFTTTSPSCNGYQDAIISFKGTGGTFWYKYRIREVTDPESAWSEYTSVFLDTDPYYVFSGLKAEIEYQIEVFDPDEIEESYIQSITIPEKEVLGFSVSQPDPCIGTIMVTASGGNPPYTITVSGETPQNGNGPDFTFTGLTAGEKIISIADDFPCPAPDPSTFPVVIDAQNPTFTNFPPNFHMTYAEYVNAYTPLPGVVAENDNSSNTLSNGGSFEYNNVDLSNYANTLMDFTYSFSGGTPGETDVIRILYSYNETDYTEIATYNSLNGNEISGLALPLQALPSHNNTVTIRVEAVFTTPGLSYDFTKFTITADEVFSVANPIVGGSPGCDDDVSGCSDSPDYKDAVPTWICNDGENIEFYFIRTWSIEDNCGKITTKDQRIAVGTPPVFDGFEASNPSLTLGFCDLTRTIGITAPSASDVCTPYDVSITWEIHDSEDNLLNSGTDNINSFDFPVGETSTVTWTATDLAGTSYSQDQLVAVRPAMEVVFSSNPATGSDICVIDTEVVFSLEVTGGLVPYTNYVYTPAGGTPGGDAANGNLTYTTNGLTKAVDLNHLTVIITDSDGCSDTFESNTFNVHDRIVTKEITRE